MTTPSPYYEHGYALLIGIAYNNSTKPLSGTLKDVDALEQHFSHPAKAALNPANVITLKEKDATRDGILNALARLSTKAAADVEASVIIYYSGHGGRKEDDYFLVPYDYSLGNRLPAKVFAEKLAAVSAKKCLVLLDCCHAEGMPVEKVSGSSQDFLDGILKEMDAVLDHEPVDKSIGDTIKKGQGRVILTSCEGHETSLDLGSNGLFTQVLLECLNGKENIERDGWVRLIDLIRYIPSNVAKRAKVYKKDQNPMFKRIENLKAEDFVVCAYDIGVATKNETPDLSAHAGMAKAAIVRLINEGNIVQAFAELDRLEVPSAFQYDRLKKEFTAGLRGVDLMDFAERLKVFVQQLK